MKKIMTLSFLLLTASLAFANGVVDNSNPAYEMPELARGAVMDEGYVKTIGRMAYVWGWPLVNVSNRRAGITQAPAPGRLGGVVPVAPMGRVSMLNDYIEANQTFVACPNQDVAYGLGFFSLDDQPVVLQIPDFGDRFWVVALYDGRTDQFGELGKAYDTEPGFYLLVGPNWHGDVPSGITAVIQSPTELGFAGPRVFLDDTAEDRTAIQPILNQIDGYPLTEYDGQWKIKDWSDYLSFPVPPSPTEGESKWVMPEVFFDQLPAVMDVVPPMAGEEALYAIIEQVLDAAAEDPRVKQWLTEVAIETERDVITPLFRWDLNGVPTGNGWNRSTNNAQWGFDYLMRTSTARSNMFDNRPNETMYYYTDNDSNGGQLDSKDLYAITFPGGQLPPVNGFWSVSLYNEHHIFTPNNLKRYSLGTKNKSLQYGDDESLTLYAGSRSPGADMESNWLPIEEGEFSLYIRAYWGQKAILDGSWIPPEIVLIPNK